MTEHEQKIIFFKKAKGLLDEYGPGMCLAKWSQTTIHLGTGHTHSCHHPGTHKIPLQEIAEDPSALHNTSYKKEKRKEMMTGKRPSECQYCWNVEDSIKDNEEIFSDRIYKSCEKWSRNMLNEILDAKWEKNVNPSYLEISFNNTCNFKCSYCSPEVSSKWMEEIEQYGAYPTSKQYNSIHWIKNNLDKMPIPEREDNPYVDAFWKWWPTLYPTLHTFRITGGEPLLTKHTFRVLDWIIENPNSTLELAINSNLVIPDELFDKFISKIQVILKNSLVKSVFLYTSCEAYGKQAEYIRFGMDYEKWISNCYKFSRECPEAKLSVMSTYNALSVVSYHKFLQDMLDLKTFRSSLGIIHHSFTIDIPYLRNPTHLNVKILTPDYLHYFDEHVKFIEDNVIDYTSADLLGFESYEVTKMKRVASLFKTLITESDDQRLNDRKDFFKFVNEHDRRRGTKFLETFPEMENFYKHCGSL